MIGQLLGNVIGKVVGEDAGKAAIAYFDKKQQLKQELKLTEIKGKIDAERAWHEWRIKNVEADAAWETASIGNSGRKDEWVLALLSIPLIMVFIPPLAPYVLQGFAILETTPEWYRWLILLIFTAIYGIRIWRRPIE